MLHWSYPAPVKPNFAQFWALLVPDVLGFTPTIMRQEFQPRFSQLITHLPFDPPCDTDAIESSVSGFHAIDASTSAFL